MTNLTVKTGSSSGMPGPFTRVVLDYRYKRNGDRVSRRRLRAWNERQLKKLTYLTVNQDDDSILTGLVDELFLLQCEINGTGRSPALANLLRFAQYAGSFNPPGFWKQPTRTFNEL